MKRHCFLRTSGNDRGRDKSGREPYQKMTTEKSLATHSGPGYPNHSGHFHLDDDDDDYDDDDDDDDIDDDDDDDDHNDYDDDDDYNE